MNEYRFIFIAHTTICINFDYRNKARMTNEARFQGIIIMSPQPTQAVFLDMVAIPKLSGRPSVYRSYDQIHIQVSCEMLHIKEKTKIIGSPLSLNTELLSSFGTISGSFGITVTTMEPAFINSPAREKSSGYS